MKRRLVLVLALAAMVATLSTGCLFSVFQTAKTVGGGNLAFTFGSGLLTVRVDEATTMSLTPQARLTIGMADAVDFGLQTGGMFPLSGGDPGWLGMVADLKFKLFDERDAFALAMGFGGGYSIEYLGWGVFGQIFFDSNLRVFPVYFAYQPGIPFAEDFTLLHHIAAGLKLRLSNQARVLLQADYRTGLWSLGVALEVTF